MLQQLGTGSKLLALFLASLLPGSMSELLRPKLRHTPLCRSCARASAARTAGRTRSLGWGRSCVAVHKRSESLVLDEQPVRVSGMEGDGANRDGRSWLRRPGSRLAAHALATLLIWLVAHKLLFFCGPHPFTPYPRGGPERFSGCVSKPDVSAYISVALFAVGALVAAWGVRQLAQRAASTWRPRTPHR